MAERVLRVSILGDSRDLERAFKKSSAASRKFDQDIKRSRGGSVAAAAGFKGVRNEAQLLGRSLVGAGGVIGVAAGLRASVSAALEAERAQTRLASAMESTNVSVASHGRAIQAAIDKTSKLAAIDDEDLSDSLARLLRTTGDVDEAMRGMALAADIARARGIDLAAATNIVEKAHVGQLRGLKGVGVQIDKNTTSTEALARAQVKFAGAGERFGKSTAGSADRLAVSLENLQEVAGKAALPVLGKVAEVLADIATDAESAAVGIGKLKAALQDLPGGGDAGRRIGDAFKDAARNASPAVDAFIKAREALKQMRAEAARPITFDIDFSALNKLTTGLQTAGLAAKDLIETRGRGTAPAGLNVTAEQRNAFFDAKIARRLDKAQDEALKAQVATLKRISASITARIAITKDITRKLTLEDELRDVNRQTRAVQAQIADNAEAARLLALDRQREAIEAARAAAAEKRERNSERIAKLNARRAARQFARLGLGPTGGELVPTRERLRQQLGTVTAAVKGTFLDTAKTRTLLAGIRKNISEALVPPDVRSKMRDLLRDLTQQLEDTARGPLTKTSGLNTKKILAGLGLDPDQIRELRGRLSGFNTAGRANVGPGGVAGGFVGGRPIVVESHTTVQMDGQTVAKTVTRNQQKKRRRNPAQRRGPNAGMAL